MFRRQRGEEASSANLIGPLVVAALCLIAVSLWGIMRSRSNDVTDISRLTSPQSNAVDRMQASTRIAESGTAGISTLLELIDHPDAKVRRAAAYGLSIIPRGTFDVREDIYEYLDDPDPTMRTRIFLTLVNQSDDSTHTLETAMQMFADPSENVAHEARHVVASLGQATVPALRTAAENPDVIVRRNVVRTLAFESVAGDATAEMARRLLRDEDRKVRYGALFALQSMGQLDGHDVLCVSHDADYRTSLFVLEQTDLFRAAGDSELVGSLISLLESSYAEIRTLSALRLAELGPVAHPAVPALKRQLQLATGISRVCIADALAAAGAEHADFLPTLREMAFDTTYECAACLSAAVLAKRAPSEAANILPRIVSNLQDADFDVRHVAASAILGLGSAAEPAAGSLMQACRNSDPDVVTLLNLAFGEFDRSHAQTRPFLIDQIRRECEQTDSYLYESLPVEPSMSPPFADLLTAQGSKLMQTLRPEFVRLAQHCRRCEPIAAAIESLGRIGRGNRQVLAAVLSGVDHPSSLVRGATALALADIRCNSRRTVVALRQLADDSDNWVKQRAVLAIIILRE